MKKHIALLLALVMLAGLLCACGREEESKERPKVKISGMTQAIPKDRELSSADEADAPETEEPKETEAAFTPVVLYDDEYCTVTQTSAFRIENDCFKYTLEVVNNSNGSLSMSLGEGYYANDLMWFNAVTRGHHFIEVAPGETFPLYVMIMVETDADYIDKKIEVSLKLDYDNGEVGVYNEKVELTNTLVCIHDPGNTASEKYQKMGTEKETVSGDGYEILLMDYGMENGNYVCTLYLENTSNDYMLFTTEDYSGGITVSSMMQGITEPVEFGTQILLAPGKGAHWRNYLCRISDADQLAQDANDVLTVNFFVKVVRGYYENYYDMASMIAENAVPYEEHPFHITRDQLRGA